MNKLRDLSIAAVIIVVVVLIVEWWLFVDKSAEQYATDHIDANGDGVVSRKELKYYLKEMDRIKNNKSLRISDMCRLMFSGFIRGLLMGFLISDTEGGLVLGLMMAGINPIVTGLEKRF